MNLKISNSTKTYRIDYLEEDIADSGLANVGPLDYDDLAHFEIQPHRPMSLPPASKQFELSV